MEVLVPDQQRDQSSGELTRSTSKATSGDAARYDRYDDEDEDYGRRTAVTEPAIGQDTSGAESDGGHAVARP